MQEEGHSWVSHSQRCDLWQARGRGFIKSVPNPLYHIRLYCKLQADNPKTSFPRHLSCSGFSFMWPCCPSPLSKAMGEEMFRPTFGLCSQLQQKVQGCQSQKDGSLNPYSATKSHENIGIFHTFPELSLSIPCVCRNPSLEELSWEINEIDRKPPSVVPGMPHQMLVPHPLNNWQICLATSHIFSRNILSKKMYNMAGTIRKELNMLSNRARSQGK